jgi:methane/ammonia monooxygenase subunit C
MATRNSAAEFAGVADLAGGRNPTDWLGGWKTLFVSCAAIMACNVFLWFWDYKYALTTGLDSSTHAFTMHYRTLFWAELISLGAFTGIWYGWLMRTGRAMVGQKITPPEEVRRIVVLWGIIGATSLSLY